MANFDLVPLPLYEAQHDGHERGYSLFEIQQMFRQEASQNEEPMLTLD